MVRGVSSPGAEESRQPGERLNPAADGLNKVISLLRAAQEAHSVAQKAVQADDTAHVLAHMEVRATC